MFLGNHVHAILPAHPQWHVDDGIQKIHPDPTLSFDLLDLFTKATR
jgi:hypothetical protein